MWKADMRWSDVEGRQKADMRWSDVEGEGLRVIQVFYASRSTTFYLDRFVVHSLSVLFNSDSLMLIHQYDLFIA